MNKKIEQFLRTEIKLALMQCFPNQQLLFKKVYAPMNVQLQIDEVIDKIPTDKLETAWELVDRTIRSNERKK